jgi:uroporphyrinogen-III decarboxylase
LTIGRVAIHAAANVEALKMRNTETTADRLAGMDFSAHNEEVRAVWRAHSAARATRVPVILGTNVRYFLFNPAANPTAINFRQFSDDPHLMFDMLLGFARWTRFNLLQDAELGLPQQWSISPNFQNYYEAAWFGCEIRHLDDQVPDTMPDFADCPERVMENGLPGPFSGLMGKALDYYQQFRARAAREQYLDRPIGVTAPCLGTDGVMTVACNLFGPEFVCTAMIEEPQRLERLLEFITAATIERLKAWWKLAEVPVPQEGFGFADDSVALISTAMYREHILPHHRRLCDELATAGPRSIHLCGDATRHFVTLRDELNIQSFDTGFPVDFAQLRRDLGPDVIIQGGPHVELLRSGTAAQVREEVRRILGTGVLEGGRFILREGNNLAPGTPLENTEAMYQTAKEYGRLN